MTLATFPFTTQLLNGRLYVSSKSCCETNGIRRVTLNPFQSSMSYGQPLSTGWDRHRHPPPLVKISWLSTCLTLVQIQQNPVCIVMFRVLNNLKVFCLYDNDTCSTHQIKQWKLHKSSAIHQIKQWKLHDSFINPSIKKLQDLIDQRSRVQIENFVNY